MIHLKCPQCGQYMVVDPSLAGRDEECPNCGKINVIPETPDSDPAPDEPPVANDPPATEEPPGTEESPATDEPPAHAEAPSPAAPTEADRDARMWAMFCHLGGLGWFVFPTFGGIIAPLVLWMLKKDDHPLVDASGKDSLNFQLTFLVGLVICFVLCFVFVGFLLAPAWTIYNVICVVMAAVRTNEGRSFRYPFVIRFLQQ